jgi:hypothetical protein
MFTFPAKMCVGQFWLKPYLSIENTQQGIIKEKKIHSKSHVT